MMMITLLLLTTQKLQLDTRTKYDSIWVPLAVYRDGQWIKSDMYEKLWTVSLPQIRCQLHDHARQYDNDDMCHDKRNGGKLHGNISRNGYGNAIIGSYGGYFEEDIRRFIYERSYHITGFGCTGEVLHQLSMWERAMHNTEEASKDGRGRVCIIHVINISHKELTYLLQKSTSHQNQALHACS